MTLPPDIQQWANEAAKEYMKTIHVDCYPHIVALGYIDGVQALWDKLNSSMYEDCLDERIRFKFEPSTPWCSMHLNGGVNKLMDQSPVTAAVASSYKVTNEAEKSTDMVTDDANDDAIDWRGD